MLMKKWFAFLILGLCALSFAVISGCGTNPTGGLGHSTSYSTISVSIEPAGTGTVEANPSGWTYVTGTTVELTASPIDSATTVFGSWEGDYRGFTSPAFLYVNGSKKILSVFRAKTGDQYNLIIPISVEAGGSDEGSVSQSPAPPYQDGTNVTLTAEAATGEVFDSWGGDLSGDTNETVVITVNGTKEIIPIFSPLYTLKVSVVPGGSGTVEPFGGTFKDGTAVRLTATANSGYKFSSWGEDLSGSTNPATITMNGNKSVEANFTYNGGSGTNVISFLYVPGAVCDCVYAYTVNANTGALTTMEGSPFTSASEPTDAVATPNGKFLYVTSFWQNYIESYRVNSSTGALTAVGSPIFFNEDQYPNEVQYPVVDPTGTFLYVSDDWYGSIEAFSINQSTGALTAVPGSPFHTSDSWYYYSTHINNLVISGTRLYAAGGLVFSIDQSTGALTELPALSFPEAWDITMDPTGTYLYGQNSGDVYAYKILGSGATGEVGGSPFSAGGGGLHIVIDPSGKDLYVDNPGEKDIYGYNINPSTGALVTIGSSPSTGNDPDGMRVDPSGKYLYLVNQDDATISGYNIDQNTGALTKITASPFGLDVFGNELPYHLAIVKKP